VLLNYHNGRFVLGSLCVGNLVRLGLSGVRVAGCSLQHGHVWSLESGVYDPSKATFSRPRLGPRHRASETLM